MDILPAFLEVSDSRLNCYSLDYFKNTSEEICSLLGAFVDGIGHYKNVSCFAQ